MNVHEPPLSEHWHALNDNCATLRSWPHGASSVKSPRKQPLHWEASNHQRHHLLFFLISMLCVLAGEMHPRWTLSRSSAPHLGSIGKQPVVLCARQHQYLHQHCCPRSVHCKRVSGRPEAKVNEQPLRPVAVWHGLCSRLLLLLLAKKPTRAHL